MYLWDLWDLCTNIRLCTSRACSSSFLKNLKFQFPWASKCQIPWQNRFNYFPSICYNLPWQTIWLDILLSVSLSVSLWAIEASLLAWVLAQPINKNLSFFTRTQWLRRSGSKIPCITVASFSNVYYEYFCKLMWLSAIYMYINMNFIEQNIHVLCNMKSYECHLMKIKG